MHVCTYGSEELCTCSNNLATQVDIPPTIPCTDADLDELPNLINPLSENDFFDVDIYERVLEHIRL